MGGSVLILLDTSALLFWTLDPARLSSIAKQTISEADEILVSSISLWEIGVKAGKGKLDLPLSPREYAMKLSKVSGVQILSVVLNVWLHSVELTWDHRDPADRVIVSEAQIRGCRLVTSDQKILEFTSLAVW